MKRNIIFFVYLFLCAGAFANKLPADITIVFKIDESNNTSVFVNNVLRTDNTISLLIEKNAKILFKVEGQNKKFKLNISLGGIVAGSFIQNSFAAGKIVSTSKDLKIGNTSLNGKNFDISIDVDGSDELFKQGFSVAQKAPEKAPDNNAPVTKPDTPETNPNKDIDSKKRKPYLPGGIYYDAFVLAHPESITQEEWDGIIAYYFHAPKAGHEEYKKMVADSTKNKFLAQTVDTAPKFKSTVKTDTAGAESLLGNLSSLSLSSIGGLDVTNIADGFAKFLVKRTKEELNVTFFSKFKEIITDSEYIDLQTVFPQTYNALLIVGDEIYNYEAYIQTLRESFENDLSTLDKNLPTIIANHPGFFNKHPELAATLNSSCYIAGALQDKVHPGEILKEYPTEYLDNLKPNWKGAIQTLQLVSESLRDSSMTDSVYWVNTKQIKELTKNADAFNIYFGLLYQVAKNDYDSIKFNSGASLVSFLNKIAPDFKETRSAFENYINRFAEKANKLNVMIKNYSKPANDSMAFEQYYNYFKSSVDLIQYTTEISKLPVIKTVLPNLADTLKNYFEVAYSTADLVLDINRRNYASAVTNAVHIYDLVKSKKAAEDLKVIKDLQQGSDNAAKDIRNKLIASVNNAKDVSELRSTNFNAVVTSSLQGEQLAAWNNADTIKQLKSIQKIKANLFRYGTFMAALVQAKSSDDVEKTIETFALPTGSSRIKRETDFNVSLNAYVGPYIGGEYLPLLKEKRTSFSAGLTAPVGIAFSWGNKKKEAVRNGKTVGGKSISIFIPIVDIGSIASFRFADDSSSVASVVELRNIVSPGLYLYYGLGKCPVSIGVGAQMGPQLRSITAKDINVDKNFYVRFGVSIAVDIPVLNFYTKSR
ncbi:MAG: hypothetical protein ABI921_05485 [Panacibacter sp.]